MHVIVFLIFIVIWQEHEDDEVTLLSSGVRKSDTEQEVEYLQERFFLPTYIKHLYVHRLLNLQLND